MSVIGIIPARSASTRLPGKLLKDETGKPLIQHTWEAAVRCASLDDVIVATDCDRIQRAVCQFGGRAELTGEHSSGTDRIAEVARRECLNAEILVNIQGDEPELDPAQIDALVDTLRRNASAQMATLASPIREMDVLADPSCTKVVSAADGRALYFSRCPIPFCRDADDRTIKKLLAGETPWKLHIGVYAYRRDFLLELTEHPPSPLEKMEKLEQLRALELGASIQVATVSHYAVGIDTPGDYARFVARQRAAA